MVMTISAYLLPRLPAGDPIGQALLHFEIDKAKAENTDPLESFTPIPPQPRPNDMRYKANRLRMPERGGPGPAFEIHSAPGATKETILDWWAMAPTGSDVGEPWHE